jgi:hypothetical protein
MAAPMGKVVLTRDVDPCRQVNAHDLSAILT